MKDVVIKNPVLNTLCKEPNRYFRFDDDGITGDIIQAGPPLDVRWHDGRIEIEPGPLPVRLKRRGRLLVVVPETEVEPLTAQAVDDTRRAIERERTGV